MVSADNVVHGHGSQGMLGASDPPPYPEYKDSGVEWLGAVPAHWEVRHLGRVGRLFKGGGGTKEDERESGVPCVRYGDLYTHHQFFITASRACVAPELAGTAYTPLRYGDVLFAASGETIDEIGKSAVNLIRGSACCGGDVIIFRPSIRAEPRFLGYASDCPSSARQKSCTGRGFTVLHIYSSDLKYVAIPLPPLPDQAAIVRFLDHADRRIRRYIRAKEKLIALLEEQKRTMIHQAVTGQIDVRSGKPYPAYKPGGAEWRGEVPEHWEVIPLGRLVTLTVGFPFKSEGFTQSDDDVRLLRGVNIAPGRIRWEDVVRWPVADVHMFAGYRLHVGDLVLGMDRPIISDGVRIAMVGQSDVPSVLLQRVARIRPGQRLITDFALLLLGGQSFYNYVTPIFTGISVPHLSPEQIKAFRFPVPSVAEQEAIVEELKFRTSSVQSALKAALKRIALVGEYRTRLVADVVTGKLDVRVAAAALPTIDPLASVDAGDDGLEVAPISAPHSLDAALEELEA